MADEEIASYEERQWQAYDQSNAEYEKCERSCQHQREVLRALEDLAKTERAMFELDNRKDQVMTTLKLALVNLVLWTRDRYFPAAYTHVTWHRLVPFFRLPGWITWGAGTVRVGVRLFNDRQLNRDLRVLCERINGIRPHLPDGRQLCFTLAGTQHLLTAGAHDRIA